MKMQRRIILLAVGMLLLAVLACGPTTVSPTAIPVQQVQPTQQPPPPPTQQPQQQQQQQPANNPPPAAEPPKSNSAPSVASSTLDVVNDTSLTVCYLYISPNTSDSWGNDWLGDTYVLDPGYVYTVEVTYGTYDILVTDCSDNTIEEHRGETLGDQPRTWTLTGAGGSVAGGGGSTSAPFTVYNQSNIDICWLWVSPTTDTQWGSEWLGDTFVLAPGYYFTETVQSGYYDLLAMDCSNNVAFEEYGIIMGDQPRDYYLTN